MGTILSAIGVFLKELIHKLVVLVVLYGPMLVVSTFFMALIQWLIPSPLALPLQLGVVITMLFFIVEHWFMLQEMNRGVFIMLIILIGYLIYSYMNGDIDNDTNDKEK